MTQEGREGGRERYGEGGSNGLQGGRGMGGGEKGMVGGGGGQWATVIVHVHGDGLGFESHLRQPIFL